MPFDSSVFICSLTTIVGCGSLMLSDNLAIQGFGLASPSARSPAW